MQCTRWLAHSLRYTWTSLYALVPIMQPCFCSKRVAASAGFVRQVTSAVLMSLIPLGHTGQANATSPTKDSFLPFPVQCSVVNQGPGGRNFCMATLTAFYTYNYSTREGSPDNVITDPVSNPNRNVVPTYIGKTV